MKGDMGMDNNENNVQNGVNENIKKPQDSGKKLTIILGIVVLILVLAAGVCAGMIFSGNGKNNGNNEINQVEEKVEKNDENKTSKKIDESKPWVYDAEYLKENKKIYEDSAKTEEYAVNSDKDLFKSILLLKSSNCLIWVEVLFPRDCIKS